MSRHYAHDAARSHHADSARVRGARARRSSPALVRLRL